ncbi:hypothetical protein FC65_GL002123 [Ligilactobacillus acidipiscis DSM 15836]|uniref:Transposase DDE domain-containing protein n=1 Tax=Ligilactobacillus acidipiscis DSM 15836 TaxID=1423716 RepID=A0ABR5PLM2_9LACO|nr:transposase [Ligilactobacillus acidipiscis]KRM26855.1 hypothetical protein FC65_GL002123 [Ligilactobacillus acidipiscis DSM 15836]GAW63209.1 transposase [Ligilactobacillus acidipiscis]GEN21892.1 hypothetical protein LAC02_51730 [Ligilactobacillus acidipiscis]
MGQLNQHQLILDLGSTHADTYGDQEKSAYNGPIRLTVIMHTLLDCLLNTQLRSGNRYTSQSATKFLLWILQVYNHPWFDILVRENSSFSAPEIYHACDKKMLSL